MDSELEEAIRHDVAVLDHVREHLAGRHSETAHEACLACQLVEARAELATVTGERDDALHVIENLTDDREPTSTDQEGPR